MAEKDATARLRRAVKENNLFLVKRLIQRTEMRNPDPAPRRYTSLAWAAVLGHEETFEFLLSAGHDDEELSKDSENNTILMLLADQKPAPVNPYSSKPLSEDVSGATLRMARLYYDRYSWILDWSNVQGKTALHIAALKGNEELVRMFCDLGADVDLSDNKGNTPLHYASSWGHIPVVQLLIERGCQYAARNNQGFTASDYAYSFSTRDTLQDTARLTFENNKKSRRNVFAQAAERGSEWGGTPPIPMAPPIVPPKDRGVISRMRSGSGTSRSTATTSDNGDLDSNSLAPQTQSSSFSASSSPSQPSAGSNSYYRSQHGSGHHTPQLTAASSTATVAAASGSTLNPPINPASALSPIANRMREQDADAMEKYLRRNRSGSSSTDNKSQNGSNYSSAGPSANGDDITALNHVAPSGASTPRRLRPSFSAAQLRATEPTNVPTSHTILTQPESRHRSGTNPTARPAHSPLPLLTRSSSISTSPWTVISPERSLFEEGESYIGPPSQYAQFPEPPLPHEDTSTPTAGRRKAFHILSKQPSSDQTGGSSHRRGMSAASVRGA
ncbi:Target of rapamycin complex 2 subunit AVO2 [Hypsizygus marmoreus]|uniref:Target of rapamycin complex 2 subunit AVO2 n=1 Tax=Hypsizygus marmoreus TaxID=39966 RepID=A0A369JQB9_HYPMA|nr:Target of rapamycin complex 2 subunit AVO2 [Hypsizygus marmoreus]